MVDLQKFYKGIKIFLNTNPLDVIRMIAKGDDEQAEIARYSLYIINFIAANLGLVILILSAYIWFSYIVPNNCNVSVYNPFSMTFRNNP